MVSSQEWLASEWKVTKIEMEKDSTIITVNCRPLQSYSTGTVTDSLIDWANGASQRRMKLVARVQEDRTRREIRSCTLGLNTNEIYPRLNDRVKKVSRLQAIVCFSCASVSIIFSSLVLGLSERSRELQLQC